MVNLYSFFSIIYCQSLKGFDLEKKKLYFGTEQVVYITLLMIVKISFLWACLGLCIKQSKIFFLENKQSKV